MAFSCEIVPLQDDRWFQVVRGQLAGSLALDPWARRPAAACGPRCGGICITRLCEGRW